MKSHPNPFGLPHLCCYNNWHIRGRGFSGYHPAAKLGTEWRSLRNVIAGMIALTAFAGCSSLTRLTGPESPPPATPAPAATAGAVTSSTLPPQPPPPSPPPSQSLPPPSQSLPPPSQSPPPSPPPAPAATASAPASTSFTSRVKGWFTGGSSETLPAAPSQTKASLDFDCPTIDYRQGAATLTVNDTTKGDNAALDLKYQASFVKTARECDVHGDMVTIRVGVQGRVVVGPAGGPGTVTVPLRYALVREGVEPRTIWTKLFAIPVTVSSSQLNVPFTHIEEELTVPIPSPSELAAYVVYIGFDPDGLKPAEKPKPAARPRAARAR